MKFLIWLDELIDILFEGLLFSGIAVLAGVIIYFSYESVLTLIVALLIGMAGFAGGVLHIKRYMAKDQHRNEPVKFIFRKRNAQR